MHESNKSRDARMSPGHMNTSIPNTMPYTGRDQVDFLQCHYTQPIARVATQFLPTFLLFALFFGVGSIG